MRFTSCYGLVFLQKRESVEYAQSERQKNWQGGGVLNAIKKKLEKARSEGEA